MNFNKAILALGIVSLAVGIISRVLIMPVPPIGLEANALLQFAGVCFLLSIALSLLKCKG